MDNKIARSIIDEVGLKKGVVAVKCGIHPVIFSDWLNNRRILTPEQVNKITDYLNRFKEVM